MHVCKLMLQQSHLSLSSAAQPRGQTQQRQRLLQFGHATQQSSLASEELQERVPASALPSKILQAKSRSPVLALPREQGHHGPMGLDRLICLQVKELQEMLETQGACVGLQKHQSIFQPSEDVAFLLFTVSERSSASTTCSISMSSPVRYVLNSLSFL